MDKIVVVVKEGAVDGVYGSFAPGQIDVEVLDLDTTDPEMKAMLEDDEIRIRQHLTRLL